MEGKIKQESISVNPIEIARIINAVYDGVERSVVGKIIKDNELGKPEIQNLAYQTFMYCLTSYLPKNVSANMEFTTNEK